MVLDSHAQLYCGYLRPENAVSGCQGFEASLMIRAEAFYGSKDSHNDLDQFDFALMPYLHYQRPALLVLASGCLGHQS